MRPLSTSASSGITSWNTTSEPVSSRRCTVEPKAALLCGILSRLIELDVRHALLQHRDPRLHVRLALLGGVVLGVLAQVPELARALDLSGSSSFSSRSSAADLVVELLEQLFLHQSSEFVESREEPDGDSEGMVTRAPGACKLRSDSGVPRRPSPADKIRSSRASRPPPTHDAQWMLLDGAHLVAEALDAGLAARLRRGGSRSRSLRRDLDALARAVPADRLRRVSRSVLEAMSPVRTPTGIVALAARPRHATVDVIRRRRRPLLVGAVDIQDPGNLGAIVRAAEAGGASGVLTTPGGSRPVRLEGRPRLHGQRVPRCRSSARRRRTRWSTRRAPRACRWWPPSGTGTRRCTRWTSRDPTLIVLGSEGAGPAAGVVEAADVRVSIPDDAARRVAQRGGGSGAAGLRGATPARVASRGTRHEADDTAIATIAIRTHNCASLRGFAPCSIAPSWL